MKKRFTILAAAFALLAFLAIPMGVWGQTATFTPSDFSGQGTSGTGSAISATVDGVTFACDKGFGTTEIRCYSGGIVTISSSNTITALAFTFSGGRTGGLEESYSGLSTTSWQQTLSSQARFSEIVVTYTDGDTPQPTTYTVTYDCNGGTSGCPQNVTGVEAGSQIQLAAAPTKTDYSFDGWSNGSTTYQAGANYTVIGNVTFTAQWTENTPPTPGGETVTLNIQAYAEANNWENGTKYTEAIVAPVTFTATGGGNTGKYYTSGQDWRFYQNESASITISVSEGFTLVSVTPTYNVNNGGVLKNGDATIASETTVTVSGTSVTFTVGNSGSATNGQVRFTNIDVTYVSDGGTQTSSDLTITNQTTDLTFDLYNNTTAQVISYTTSSTGDITINPVESDYFSYVHDAVAKTVTITPTAVTPSAQTVTIHQAADDDYYAGTVTFTVSVANSDPSIPGTQNNPYTVAQARAAIDAGTGTQGVYAIGIVSAIPTAYNSTYGNVTFNMVDEEGDEVFLQAYRCGGDEAADVQIGDVVVVYGNLTKYGSTYEFGQGCQIVSLEHSANPIITVANATVDAPAAGAEGVLTVTYLNIEEIVANVYFCDANGAVATYNWIYAEIDDDNNIYYNVDANDGAARTAYLKVNDGDVYSNLVTINQEAYVAPTYADLPFEYNDGLAGIEETDGLYQDGLGSDYNTDNTKLRFDHTGDWLLLQFNERPGTLTFDIKGNSFSGGTFKVQTSEDGETYTDLATYNELGATQSEEFSNLGENVRYIKWIYSEKVSGNVGLGNIHLYEFGGGPVAETYDLTIEPFENLEIFTFVDDELTEPFEGAGTIQVTEGVNVMLSVSAEPGYVMQSLMVDGVEHVDDIDEGMTYTFVMPNHNVTVSATAVAFEPATYTLVTSTDQIVSGKTYIIVGFHEGEAFAMGEQRSSNRKGVAISVDGNTATVETPEVHEVVITALEEDGFYSIFDEGYLYAASSTGNQLKTKAELDVNGQWVISFDTTTHIVASNSENRNVMQFNYNNNNPALFNCYSDASQSPVYLYVKEEATTNVTQVIELASGQNWVSFNVETDLAALQTALTDVLGTTGVTIQIKSQQQFTKINRGRWTGSLTELDVAQMYVITVSSDCEIQLEGMPVDPAQHSITINGTSWIAYPLLVDMSLTDAFNGFAVNGDAVNAQTLSAKVVRGRWTGQLTGLEPGKGYKYTSGVAGERTLVFPTSAK